MHDGYIVFMCWLRRRFPVFPRLVIEYISGYYRLMHLQHYREMYAERMQGVSYSTRAMVIRKLSIKLQKLEDELNLTNR